MKSKKIMQTNLFTSNLAEISISYSQNVKSSEMRQIAGSKDAVEILRSIWTPTMEHHESFYVLVLNRANKVMGYYKASEGGYTGTVADPKMIFSMALKTHACALLLAHNHPSGNTQPSTADIQLTKNIVECGKFLEINILDHVILTSEGYYSFADEGLI